jgi:hypothetical protein
MRRRVGFMQAGGFGEAALLQIPARCRRAAAGYDRAWLPWNEAR